MSHLIETLFPALVTSDYTIESPQTPEYNCIAWAVSQDDVWWWPDPMFQAFWPPEAPREETVDAFIAAFATLKYIPCDNADPEPGFEKIALYTSPDGKPTHAARQLRTGKWASKLGQLHDIEHTTLSAIEGGRYGVAGVFLKRTI